MAGRYQEPAAKQPLSLVQLGRDKRHRACTILATRRRPLPVGKPNWRNGLLPGAGLTWVTHQHSGMMPSGRLKSWQCWRLCRQM